MSADIVTDTRSGAQFYTAALAPHRGEIEANASKEPLTGQPVEVYI